MRYTIVLCLWLSAFSIGAKPAPSYTMAEGKLGAARS
jgi:hypothetical protein